uniref:LisH domain-containing protein n=1 Tax=Trichuris muris TaxID=70415 RepID=A0A5S6QDX9_TRIMR
MQKDCSGSIGRTSSAQTLDSLDCTRISDEPEKRYEERISILEFELRQANATVKTLREHLTLATSEADVSQGVSSNCIPEEYVKIQIKPHEQRVLNFLINEYLLKNDFKITSVTFSEEVRNQDFDSWADVGLNLARPPDLLTIYRHGFASLPQSKPEMRDANVQIDISGSQSPASSESIPSTNSFVLLNRLNAENSSLLERNQYLEEELRLAKAKLEVISTAQADSDLRSPSVAEQSSDQPTANEVDSPHGEVSRTRQSFYKRLSSMLCACRPVSGEFAFEKVGYLNAFAGQAAPTSEVIQVIGELLFSLIPKISIRKRECILPLIAVVVIAHPVSKRREELCAMMFDLFKHPDTDQRQALIDVCTYVASKVDSTRVETEILVHCVQRIDSRSLEQRTMAAEVVSALTPFMSKPILSSLIVSVLRQMILSNNSEKVLVAMVQACSRLCCFITANEKFPVLNELFLTALNSANKIVVDQALSTFLPSLAVWAMEDFALLEKLVTSVLSRMECVVDLLYKKCAKGGKEHQQLNAYFDCLGSLVPVLFWDVVRCNPAKTEQPDDAQQADCNAQIPREYLLDDLTLYASASEVQRLAGSFRQLTEMEWHPSWQALDFVTRSVLTPLVVLIRKVEASDYSVLCSAVHCFTRFANFFGQGFVRNRLCPLLQIDRAGTTNKNDEEFSNLSLPICTIAVLGKLNQKSDTERLQRFLKKTVTTVAERNLPVRCLILTLLELIRVHPEKQLVFDVMHTCSEHPSRHVRSHSASILSDLAGAVSAGDLELKILSLLTKLANDSSPEVRVNTVMGLCSLASGSESAAQVSEDAKHELGKIFADVPGTIGNGCAAEMLGKIARFAPTFAIHFLDYFFLPQLYALTQRCHAANDESTATVLPALFDVYIALSCCCFSPTTVSGHFLPGLRVLSRELDTRHAKVAQSIIIDQERKLYNFQSA